MKKSAIADVLTGSGLLLAMAAGSLLAVCAGQRLPAQTRASLGIDTGWSVLIAGLVVLASGGMDMLDGWFARHFCVARPMGAVFDSTADRISDSVILAGCAINFACSHNLVGVTAAWIAATNSFLISYLRAKGEQLGFNLDSGFWRRPERICAIAFGCIVGHVEAAVFWIAAASILTVAHRFRGIRRCLRSTDRRRHWVQSSRSTISYAIFAALTALFVITDPLTMVRRDLSKFLGSCTHVSNTTNAIRIE